MIGSLPNLWLAPASAVYISKRLPVMKHTKKKKQAKQQAQQCRQMQQFFKMYPAEVSKEILWQMLKFSISKNDRFITVQQRSNMILFYHMLPELLTNSQNLLQQTNKKQPK
jgi:hypothetical protein